MVKNGVSALTVARPGRLRDSLNICLVATPYIAQVDSADDSAAVLRRLAESSPALVLLDMDLVDGEVQATLGLIKARWPQARCIVLADDVRQQREANAAGADGTLLRGFSVTELFATVEKLLALGTTPTRVALREPYAVWAKKEER
jgi:DNA-binding NarL/FixJ family response regulator